MAGAHVTQTTTRIDPTTKKCKVYDLEFILHKVYLTAKLGNNCFRKFRKFKSNPSMQKLPKLWMFVALNIVLFKKYKMKYG